MQLEVEDVVKTFDDVRALDHCSLTLLPGEITTLLGASGAGKTTLLWMIAGLLTPDRGRIRVCGRDVTDLPPQRREIGLVFQSYVLFPHLSVFENIAYGLRVRRCARDMIKTLVARMIGLLRLDGLEQRLPATLSGGQQQRVALARALVLEPALLLLDEPFNALDALLRHEMQAELRQVIRELGMTALIVTHEQDVALAISDRIAVIDQGRILQSGPPLALYDRPIDWRVAAFIGNANLLHRHAQGGKVRLADGLVLPTEHVGAVVVVVRPENICISPGQAGGAWRGSIASVRPSGPSITYDVDVGWDMPLKVSQSRLPNMPLLTEGQRIAVKLRDPDACVVLRAHEPVR